MKLPAEKREGFIIERTVGDPDMGRQLRGMVQLGDVSAGGVFNERTSPPGRAAYDLPPGTIFGDCRILDPIGAGGMGAVYYALDQRNHNRPVAVKVLPPALISAASRERFDAETAALALLIHPNIARLYFRGIGDWNQNQLPFLVMEHVEGSTLDKFLDKQRLSTRQILELLQKIARAVHYGHLKGVFHRDLKPSNILVTADGEPKIVDYGVSYSVNRALVSEGDLPRAGNAGTIPYMAPEVASGAEYIPDARTDVYSLGVIAFEAFARRRPGVRLASGAIELLDPPIATVSAEVTQSAPLSRTEMRQKIAACERERLRQVSKKFAYDLDCVIAKSLRHSMDERYTDANEFAEDLRRLMEFHPIKQLRRSRLYVARKFVRRNRLMVAAGSAVMAAVIGSAILFRIEEVREKQLSAAAHFHAAEFAAQRGNWVAAVDEYRSAEQQGYPDQLALAVGKLRALDRSNRTDEAQVLLRRVHTTMPRVAADPEFQVVEGFFDWISDPNRSELLIRGALQHVEQLRPADLAFAQALVSEDMKVVRNYLLEAVRNDPFNYDAHAIIAMCDLAMGESARAEQEAGVLQRLFPTDGLGPALGAISAAFGYRREAALMYLKEATGLPAQVKSAMAGAIDLILQYRTLDDAKSVQPWILAFHMGSIIPNFVSGCALLTPGHSFPLPLTFRRLIKPLLQMKLSEAGLSCPSGDADYIRGLQAVNRHDYAAAIKDFQAAIVNPAPLNCSRSAAALVIRAQYSDDVIMHRSQSQREPVIKAELDQLISAGGVRPDLFKGEDQDLAIGLDCQCYKQVLALALQWFARQPDEPRAMYYIAAADSGLGDRDTALWMYQHAIDKGLTGAMKTDAQAKIGELRNVPATRPATMPR